MASPNTMRPLRVTAQPRYAETRCSRVMHGWRAMTGSCRSLGCVMRCCPTRQLLLKIARTEQKAAWIGLFAACYTRPTTTTDLPPVDAAALWRAIERAAEQAG